MTPISRTFFLTGLGRSGTAFLAAALGQSSSHRVVHEWKIPRTPLRDGRLTRFPLWRFYVMRHPLASVRMGYGEVNSHLRRTLSPTKAGREALVERRGVILRDPRDVIASGMNRSGRTDADFAWLSERILRDFALLNALLVHPSLTYARFDFQRFTTSADEIHRIADWAGLEGVDVPEQIVARKINTNKTDGFPRWADWSPAHRHTFDQLMDRLEIAPSMLEL